MTFSFSVRTSLLPLLLPLVSLAVLNCSGRLDEPAGLYPPMTGVAANGGAPVSTAGNTPLPSGNAGLSGMPKTGGRSGFAGATSGGSTGTPGGSQSGNGGGVGGTSNAGDNSAAGNDQAPGEECTDTPPDDRETCATWAEWGECDAAWLKDPGYCNASCGRCEGDGSGGTTNGGSTSTGGGDADTGGSTSGAGGDSDPDDLGDDNPYPPINGGSQGWASRYWDCCKQSCAWEGNASSPVHSCDKSDNSLGVTDERNSCEMDGRGGAFTCHSMAPWAHSNTLSYGFAAINGVRCGQCFQIQFTGRSHNAGNDSGSSAIAGKTMIIQATNIGGIERGQFDLLIPGGGVGALNGCAGQWNIDNSELGAQYGGFLPDCKRSQSDHSAVKQCMRDKCQSVFGTRDLMDLYDGCMWFVDWFEVADNPTFVYQPVDCPEALVSRSGSR